MNLTRVCETTHQNLYVEVLATDTVRMRGSLTSYYPSTNYLLSTLTLMYLFIYLFICLHIYLLIYTIIYLLITYLRGYFPH